MKTYKEFINQGNNEPITQEDFDYQVEIIEGNSGAEWEQFITDVEPVEESPSRKLLNQFLDYSIKVYRLNRSNEINSMSTEEFEKQVEGIEEHHDSDFQEFLEEKDLYTPFGNYVNSELLDTFYNWSVQRKKIEDRFFDYESKEIEEGMSVGKLITKGVYLSRVSKLLSKLKKSSSVSTKVDIVGELLKVVVQYQVFGTR